MVKSQYRSEMAVIHEILAITSDGGRFGTNISHIASKANLSHYSVVERGERLLNAGLIEQQVDKRSRIYRMTEKGLMFFKELDKFQNIVCSLNLRY